MEDRRKYYSMSQYSRYTDQSSLCPKITGEMFQIQLVNFHERLSRQQGKGLLMIRLKHTHCRGCSLGKCGCKSRINRSKPLSLGNYTKCYTSKILKRLHVESSENKSRTSTPLHMLAVERSTRPRGYNGHDFQWESDDIVFHFASVHLKSSRARRSRFWAIDGKFSDGGFPRCLCAGQTVFSLNLKPDQLPISLH